MILIVTNKRDYTADFLVLGMKRRDVEFLRLNTEDFPQRIQISLEIGNRRTSGVIRINRKTTPLENIHSIWYRRPLLSEPSESITDDATRKFVIVESRETLQGLWRTLSCVWVSHPDKIRVAESKLYQLQIASQIGFVIPQTLITNSPSNAQNFYEASLAQLIYKPQRHGQIERGEDVSLLYTSVISESHRDHFDSIALSPVLFQHYIPKRLELRVTVVGKCVFAVELHSQEIPEARHDWRKADTSYLKHVPCELPSDVEEKCILLVKTLGLAFGAIDLILTPEGEYVFLEINPNGQWAWIEQTCPEVRISDALIDLLTTGTPM